jgi:transposase
MDVQARVAKLRAELARRAGAGTRGRFTQALREEALAVLRERAAQGATQEAVAKELGMSAWTLSRWSQRARVGSGAGGASPPAAAAFRPVRVVRREEGRPSSPGALTVHGPAGLRVEGLTVEWVAALVRALRG